MIVKPSVGFDQVKFGMTELEVIALLGKPDLIKVDDNDEDQNIVYQYNDLKVKLTFYTNENNELSYIRTTNPNAGINNITIIDQPLNIVFNGLKISKNEWEEELYFSFNAYFNQEMWLTLHEEFGRVTNIEMGRIYINDKDEENLPK